MKTENRALEMVDATLLKPFKEYEIAALLAGINHDDGDDEIQNENGLDDEALFSLDNFNAFAGDDAGVLKEFLISFMETNEEHLMLLKSYFEAGDYVNVGDTAHKMKNTFGQLKAKAVMHHLQELEKLVDSPQPKKLVKERISETQKLSKKLFSILKKEVEEMS